MVNLHFHWTEHDVSPRRAKQRTLYWSLKVGGLDREIAQVETKPKSFEAYCWLPGADNEKKRYYKTPEEAKAHAEKIAQNWFDAVLIGATTKEAITA